MIADVIDELLEPFTTKQIVDAVVKEYSAIRPINEDSLSVDIAGCCVNLRSRHHLPGLPALLVSVSRGLYRRYDPEKDRDLVFQPQVFGENRHRIDKMEPFPEGGDISLDLQKAEKIGKILRNLFETRTGFFAGYIMPEYVLPKNIREGSLEHALYLTYVISVDYQTDAVKLWRNARQTYSEKPEYFNPKNVVAMKLEQLSSILRDLGARYPTNGAKAWKTISSILLEEYDGDPRNITPEPLTITQVKKLIQKFPNLKGKKLSNFYLRAMGEKGLFRIKDLNELDIPVDVQVAKFTIYTGCLQLTKGSLTGCIHEPPIQPAVEEIWRKAARVLGIAPWELDEPIWTIGSKLCSPRYCSPCPVQHICAKNFDANIQGNNIYWKK